MRKIVLAAIAALTLAGAQNGPRQMFVPKAWGDFKAVYNDQLLFEDNQGTIRFVYPSTGQVTFSVARR